MVSENSGIVGIYPAKLGVIILNAYDITRLYAVKL